MSRVHQWLWGQVNRKDSVRKILAKDLKNSQSTGGKRPAICITPWREKNYKKTTTLNMRRRGNCCLMGNTRMYEKNTEREANSSPISCWIGVKLKHISTAAVNRDISVFSAPPPPPPGSACPHRSHDVQKIPCRPPTHTPLSDEDSSDSTSRWIWSDWQLQHCRHNITIT